MSKRSVLFVCLGNICRSPMAEAIFIDLLKKSNDLENWIVDSAGILDIHLGKGPYVRTLETLKANGITEYHHKVRQVTSADFSKFDFILGMDHENISDLIAIQKYASTTGQAKVELLGSYDLSNSSKIIDDPYYVDNALAFNVAFDTCYRACHGFLEAIRNG